MDNTEDYSTKINNISELEQAKDLYVQFAENVDSMDKLSTSIAEAEVENDLETLEQLYHNEFMLYMDHTGIFEDLLNKLDTVEKTTDNEFELARIRRDAIKMFRGLIVEVL